MPLRHRRHPRQENSNWSIAGIGQGGVALPDRDYYLSDAADRVAVRAKYVAHVARTLRLLGGVYADAAAASAAADSVLAFETTLARAHLTPAERRDAERTYNKFLPDVATLTRATAGWDWRAYFDALGKSDPGEVNVTWPPALETATRAVVGPDAANRDAIRAYASFHAACRASEYLSDDFVDADFDFFGRELNGQMRLKPRWKRVVSHANGLVGELVGRAYVAKHFPSGAKTAVVELVRAVAAAVEERLREVPWMTEATKTKALKKWRGSA